MGGTKFDGEKPDISLIPREALEGTAKVLMFGANKYGRYNWLGGFEWHRLTAASLRHIIAFNEGEDLDPESGMLHIYHAICCLSMLATHYERGLGKDDRYKGEDDE